MLLSLMPVIVQIAFWVLEKFVVGQGQATESRRIFLELAQILRANGVKGARSRFESEEQIQSGDDEWTRREQEAAKASLSNNGDTHAPDRTQDGSVP